MLKQLRKQDLNEQHRINAALHYADLIDKLKMAQNNKPDEDIFSENDQIMDYTTFFYKYLYLSGV